MAHVPSQDPLHGLTLQVLLERLVTAIGWRAMADHVQVRCFMFDPTITSSLKFLRKTPWARQKVEGLYCHLVFTGVIPVPPSPPAAAAAKRPRPSATAASTASAASGAPRPESPSVPSAPPAPPAAS